MDLVLDLGLAMNDIPVSPTVSPVAPPPPSWQSFAELKPRLRRHIRIKRHIYRGQLTYILDDRLQGQLYRFSPEAYSFIGHLTGEHNVREIHDTLKLQPEKKTPDKKEIIEILGHLHTMSALVWNLPSAACELLPRQVKSSQEQNSLLSQLKRSVLFLRFPLLDPEKFLQKYNHIFSAIFCLPFFLFLLGLFAAALVTLLLFWQQLSSNFIDTLFTRNNLFIIVLLYPCIKGIHELAHAFAVKKWGGEVHEMGLMFLIFMPIPYVNASASASFSDKWQRISVASAGILAELSLAATALIFWSQMEPGLSRTIAYNVFMIGGISTLLFNGNPLTRFDGYYILSDLLEIPNLAQRSRSYLLSLFGRYLFGISTQQNIPGTPAEKRYYLVYGLASFLYRLTIYGSIFLLLSSKFSAAGAIFGLFAITQMLFRPLINGLQAIFSSSRTFNQKSKTVAIGATLFLTIFTLFTLIPLPYSSQFEGVLLPPEDAQVRMNTSGTVLKLTTQPNSQVRKGDLLLKCEDPELDYSIAMLQSQVREYRQRKKSAFANDPFEATIVQERLKELTEELQEKIERKDGLTIKSPATGTFVIPGGKSLAGRFLHQGELLAYIVQPEKKVRLLVAQEEIDTITGKTSHIELVLAPDLRTVYQGKLLTPNPQARRQLPSKVLGSEGGGKVLTIPDARGSLQLTEEMFQLDIGTEQPIELPFIGCRAFIRFYHDSEPFLGRWLRSLRQLFLKHFHS